MAAKRKMIRYSAGIDIVLLKEVDAQNLFKDKEKWTDIAKNVEMAVNKNFSVDQRGVRERTYLLLDQYSEENRAPLRRFALIN